MNRGDYVVEYDVDFDPTGHYVTIKFKDTDAEWSWFHLPAERAGEFLRSVEGVLYILGWAKENE